MNGLCGIHWKWSYYPGNAQHITPQMYSEITQQNLRNIYQVNHTLNSQQRPWISFLTPIYHQNIVLIKFWPFAWFWVIVWCWACLSTDPSQESHNASDKYPTMHYFVTEMCTHVHISVTKQCIVGYENGALWDLCNRSTSMSSCTPPHPYFYPHVAAMVNILYTFWRKVASL